MKRIRLIISLVSIVFSIALLTIITFSWYVNINTSQDMKFEILQIQSLVSLYQGKDTNHNGVPDKLATTNYGKYYNPTVNSGIYINYADYYYTETYDFTYLDQRYALARDSESNLLNTIEINDIVPSKVYTYKFEITNLSQRLNYVSFGFDSDNTVDVAKLSTFTCRMGIVDNTGHVTFTSWHDFVSNNAYSAFTITDPSLTVAGKTGTLDVGRLDCWLEIKQKSEATLSFTSFILPQFRLTLSIDV